MTNRKVLYIMLIVNTFHQLEIKIWQCKAVCINQLWFNIIDSVYYSPARVHKKYRKVS